MVVLQKVIGWIDTLRPEDTEILLTEIYSRCDRQTPPIRSKQLPVKVLQLRLLLFNQCFQSRSQSQIAVRSTTCYYLRLLVILPLGFIAQPLFHGRRNFSVLGCFKT